jgi:AraC family transcriptional regulator of adaptative response/methylated-DNA-[protein]-cysteine methyltransferase
MIFIFVHNRILINMNILPSSKIMYRALLEKDSSFEGLFYVGVKTTGIFCRPTCPAKKPKAENVEYFATASQALYGGYRPCLKCKPLDKDKKPPELVTKLKEAVEKSPTGKFSDSDLQKMGIEPSTARRQFKSYYKMTFHEYHRSRRMGLALHGVRSGEDVLDAQLKTGFESASGFWEAFKKIFGAPPGKAEQVEYLFAKWIDTPLGAMIALANSKGIYLLEFVDRRGLENEIVLLRKRTKCVIVPGNNKHIEKISEELKNYFEGKSINFTVPFIINGSDFEKKVWGLLQTIPPGETWSYMQLAKKTGNPAASRAVGRANGRNIIALAIPCHRVIRADGNLCGYGGGIWRKQWLINHEKEVMGKKK